MPDAGESRTPVAEFTLALVPDLLLTAPALLMRTPIITPHIAFIESEQFCCLWKLVRSLELQLF